MTAEHPPTIVRLRARHASPCRDGKAADGGTRSRSPSDLRPGGPLMQQGSTVGLASAFCRDREASPAGYGDPMNALSGIAGRAALQRRVGRAFLGNREPARAFPYGNPRQKLDEILMQRWQRLYLAATPCVRKLHEVGRPLCHARSARAPCTN